MGSIFKGLLISAMGQTLSNSSALSALVKEATKTLAFSLIAALWGFTFAMTGLYALYRYMMLEGATEMQSILTVTGIMLLITLISSLLAHKSLKKLQTKKQKTLPPSPKKMVNDAQDIAEAFILGFLNHPKPKNAEPKKTPIELIK